MNYFETIPASVLTFNPEHQSIGADQFISESLADIFPDASPRKLKEAMEITDYMVDMAIDGAEGKTDDVGTLILTATALAVTLQGRKTIFGRWKPGVLDKGQDPQAFWESLISDCEPEDDQESKKSAKEIMFEHASKDTPQALELMNELIGRMTMPGSPFESLDPNTKHLYLLDLDQDQIADLQSELDQAGHKRDLDTSTYYGYGTDTILLGTDISNELFVADSSGFYARGTLVHELGHGFTTKKSNFWLLGDLNTARIPSEMQAEFARLSMMYPSHSYTAERGVQYGVNDIVGYDLVRTNIEELRDGNYEEDQDLLKDYARRLISVGGIVLAGLVLGAQPKNYLDQSDGGTKSHDISLLGYRPFRRYSALSYYTPRDYRYLLADNHIQSGEAAALWQESTPEQLARKQWFSKLVDGFSRTTKIYC